MDKNILVETWTATLFMNNGQTVEIEVQAKSIKKAREKVKNIENVRRILSIKRFKL
jgi:hypothetical protein